MKKILILTAGIAFLSGIHANAQIQIGAQGSYLKGTGDNNTTLWGGGAHAKFYLGQRLAFGGVVRVYPKNTSSETIGGTTYTSGDYITNVAGTFDILLGKKDQLIQPYIGADAGVSINNHTVTYTNNNQQVAVNNNKTFFLLSPKVGVNLGLLPSFGVFGQAQYNAAFGDGENLNNTTFPSSFNTKPVDKYFTFDVGLYFRLTGAKK